MPTAWPLEDLTAGDQALLADVAEGVTIAPGGAIVTTGEHPGALLLIEAGEASVEVRGREIARVGPGTLVGEMSFASGDPAMATVVALGPVRVARVSTAAVAACAGRAPGFSGRLYRAIARVIVERLRQQRDELFEADAGDPELPVFTDGFAAVRDATLPPVAARHRALRAGRRSGACIPLSLGVARPGLDAPQRRPRRAP